MKVNKESKSYEEQLMYEFQNELSVYSPNWKKIAETNQVGEHGEIITYEKKLEGFCKAIADIKSEHHFSLRRMGEKLSCSYQYIFNIVNKKIKKIPVKRFADIAMRFSVSEAYLLGLVDDRGINPDIAECYFWEYPQSKFLALKDCIEMERLYDPMALFGAPTKKLTDYVCEELSKDYTLLSALHKIFKAPFQKREAAKVIIKNLEKIL